MDGNMLSEESEENFGMYSIFSYFLFRFTSVH